jgi:site-specific recombinase XerD
MIKLDIAHKQFIKKLEDEGKSSSTLVAYKKDIEQLIDHLQKQNISLVSEIELKHLEEFMDKLGAQSYTLKSISRKTNATKTFFRFLHASKHVVQNVADLLKHPKVEIRAPRILSKMEYRALRDAARDDLRSYAMIEILLQTGATISELADIRLENLDIKSEPGNLFVPKKNNREARNIPLNRSVVEAIRKYIDNQRPNMDKSNNLFITKTGKALLVRNIRSTINRYFKLAGVEKATVNDLRHTFVAHHLANGVSILHISKIAGHKRISTTERYLQYIEKTTTEERTELGIL